MEEEHKLSAQIMREMLTVAFERIGDKILKDHPEFSAEEVRVEASRLTSIYLENYDRERHEFDVAMIQRMFDTRG